MDAMPSARASAGRARGTRTGYIARRIPRPRGHLLRGSHTEEKRRPKRERASGPSDATATRIPFRNQLWPHDPSLVQNSDCEAREGEDSTPHLIEVINYSVAVSPIATGSRKVLNRLGATATAHSVIARRPTCQVPVSLSWPSIDY